MCGKGIVLGSSRTGAEEYNQEAGRNYDLYSLTKCYPVDHIEEGEMGWACGRLGERRNECMSMKAVPVVMCVQI